MLVALPSRFVLLFLGLHSEFPLSAQGLGTLLTRKIDGDFHNVVGFPGAAFFKMLDLLVEEDEDFLAI